MQRLEFKEDEKAYFKEKVKLRRSLVKSFQYFD